MIREYMPADKDRLIELLKLNIPDYFAPAEEQDFSEYLDHKTEDYYVVEQGTEIVGCGGINYLKGDQAACLSWDMFHPRMQGQGLGRQLVLFRIEQVKNGTSYRRIIVRTSQHAYGFYEKLGFSLKEMVPDYWAPGFDLYLMEMSLS